MKRRKYQFFKGKVAVKGTRALPRNPTVHPRDTHKLMVEGVGDYIVRDCEGTASERMGREFAFSLARSQHGRSYVIHCCANRLIGTVPFDPHF